jgi:hypothetical protein
VKPNYPESLEELTLNRTGSPEEGSSSESESEEFPASRDQLKARVYSLIESHLLLPDWLGEEGSTGALDRDSKVYNL